MNTRPLRVLALDDEPSDLEVLRRRLAEHVELRAEFVGCTDAASASAELAKNHFDVLLLDERLGVVSGAEVLCDLRRSGHSIPAVMLGSSDDETSVASAIRAGAAECVSKRSLTGAKLAAAISWALERRPSALPVRSKDLVDLCTNLSSSIAPTLEAARASLACVLADAHLSIEQRDQLADARSLCTRAIDELEQLLHELDLK